MAATVISSPGQDRVVRVLVLGGTCFLGRRVVERLHVRGDSVLVAHRGRSEPAPWISVRHLHTDRTHLAEHTGTIAEFAPDAVVDSCPLTAADVDAVLPVLPEVPAVVLSSQDVYEAFTGLRSGRELSALPIPKTPRCAVSAIPTVTRPTTRCPRTTTSSTSSNGGFAAVLPYCDSR